MKNTFTHSTGLSSMTSCWVLTLAVLTVTCSSALAQITIPFGNSGGGLRIGPQGIGIRTPGSFDSHTERYRPGVTFNIPIPQDRNRHQHQPQFQNRSNRYPRYQPKPRYESQPRYYNPPQTYTKPKVVAPQPPKNVIKTRKKPASNSVNFNLISSRASAETDARQAIEAEKSKNMLDTVIIEQLKNSGNPEMLKDWQEVVRDGSRTQDVAAFMQKYDGTLNSELKDTLKLRQDFGMYSDAVQVGNLTYHQKEQALNHLTQRLEVEATKPGKNSAFVKTLIDNVDRMKNFNTLGQIADASQNSSNPFSPLVQGANQIGMPIMFLSELTGMPAMGIDPVSDYTGEPGKILIYNPSKNGQSVSYLLGTHEYTMKPGLQQELSQGYEISFDSGKGGATKRYQLTSGVYEWRNHTSTGWNLFKVTVKVTIDNSRYEGNFHYLLDNQPQSLAPGEVVEHSSETPIEIAFDPGNGSKESRKLLKSGQYVVGIDSDQGNLDLFDYEKVEEHEAEEPNYISSTRFAGNNATRSQRIESLLSQLKRPGQQSSDLFRPQLSSGAGIFPLGGNTSARKKNVNELLHSLK